MPILEPAPNPIVLAYLQARQLLRARQAGAQVLPLSLDLGLSTATVVLETERVVFPDGQWLSWEAVAAIEHGAPICFMVAEGGARKIHRFSEALSRAYSLMATEGAPALINAGFTMHRIVGIDPHQDTLRKLAALGPAHGPVLDTCTGLGYTAIEAARTASAVTTIEIDPVVLEVARLNPWSRALFTNPAIEQLTGDAAELIEALPAAHFARIMHDPPTLSLAGELYSGQFYRQLLRVLRPGGRLFHYVGNPGSKQGSTVSRGVARRLGEVGFAAITPRPEAFGIAAERR